MARLVRGAVTGLQADPISDLPKVPCYGLGH